MQLPVRVGHLVNDGAMNRCGIGQRQERAVEPAHDFGHRAALAAHDALARRVEDQQVGPGDLRAHAAHRVGRPIDDARRPLDGLARRQPPRLAGGVAGAGQVADEQRRFLHRPEHRVAIGPGPQREQARRFAEAVADHRVGFHAEAVQQVAHETAERHLGEDLFAVGGGTRGRFVPELFGKILAAQTAVVRVLAPQDARPPQGEVAAHAGEVVARAREDERNLSARAQRVRRIKGPVAQDAGRRQRLLRVKRQMLPHGIQLAEEIGPVPHDEGDGQRLFGSLRLLPEPMACQHSGAVLGERIRQRPQSG
jgi:hypothetical protein